MHAIRLEQKEIEQIRSEQRRHRFDGQARRKQQDMIGHNVQLSGSLTTEGTAAADCLQTLEDQAL
ncbi:MAG: hypothetical protein M1823_008821, partial [Watsoniomyces obsoletus]